MSSTRSDRGFRFPLQKYSDEKALYTNFRYLQEYLNYIRRKDKFTATYDIARSGTDAEARAAYVASGTNDHVQIQAALDALPSAGGHIYIHEGTYDIQSRITFPNKPVLMSGPGTISFNLNDTGFMGGNNHHVLHGLNFTGRTGSEGGNHKYSIDKGNWHIENCRFKNMHASIIIGGRNSLRMFVVNNVFDTISFYNDGRASPDIGVIGTGDGGTPQARGHAIGNYFHDIDFTNVTALGKNLFLVHGDNNKDFIAMGNVAEDVINGPGTASLFQHNASHNVVDGVMIAGTHTGLDHGNDLTGLNDDDHTQYVLRSILTTQGDLFTRDASAIKRLALGTSGDFLKAGASEPAWATLVEADISDLDHTDSDAVHDNVAGEINALTAPTLASGDVILIEDADDSFNKKKTTVGDIQSAETDHGGLTGLADDDHTQYMQTGEVDQLAEVVSGYTNTSFADLDDVTHGTPFSRGVSVTITTGTTALVIISANTLRINDSAESVYVGYKVSGASTISADEFAAMRSSVTNNLSNTYFHLETGLTAGSNTFELQTRVTGSSGVLRNPTIMVVPLRT